MIRAKRKFTENEARDIFVQVLKATAYLHFMGIAHRDLKVG